MTPRRLLADPCGRLALACLSVGAACTLGGCTQPGDYTADSAQPTRLYQGQGQGDAMEAAPVPDAPKSADSNFGGGPQSFGR